MRVVVTGAGGFVGGGLARRLRGRGDEVVALVRNPARSPALADAGVELVADDLSDVARLTERLRGADAAIHAAGSYKVGIPAGQRDAMLDANVGTTTRFIRAAEAAAVARTVYVSTVNAFGNTHGRVVDETYRRDVSEGFVSWYDETKYRAHEVAEGRIAAGAPILVAMPSQVYGPGDRSMFGEQLLQANRGKLRYRVLDGVGIGLVHVDDLADGVLAVLDRGEIARTYILSGPTTTLGNAIATAAKVAGRRPPRLRVPTRLLRLIAPLGGLIGQPNMRELISASDGVTYWATSARAEGELGWTARPIEVGLRDTFGGA
jgi:dihydroflavonol-4-reductase